MDGEEQLENILEIRDKLPALKVIVQYGGLVEKGSHKDRRVDGIYSWEQFLHWGDKTDDRALRARIAAQVCETFGMRGQIRIAEILLPVPKS